VKALGLEYVSPEADFYEKLLVIWKKEAGYSSNFYDYRQFPTELMGPYGACDTWLTLGIDEYHQRNNFESLFGEYAKHEHGMARRLFHAEERGIKVDIPYFEELKEDYEKQIFLEESAVKVWAGKSDLNLNSQPQLKKVLYDELKLPVQKSWDKDKQDWKITTDKTALLMLQGKHPIVDHLQKHRKLTKLYGTYILGILNNYNPHTYRIHTTFNQFVENSSALRTGRLSSSDPINFENIPRNDTAIRRGFLPDTEFVFCDYAGQEIRLYTLYSREPTLIKAFANGEDVHSRTCAAVFLLDYDYIVKNRKTDKDIELKREIAKRIFFGALYGAGYKRVANILAEFGYGYDEKEGKRLLANLYSNYPNFPRYMANVDKRIKERGFVTDIFKRQYIPKNAGVNYPVGNYLIQGTAGGMLKQVSNTIGDVFGDDIFSNWIHDEIAFDRLPNRKAIIEIKEIMEHWPMIDIPMVVDVSWTNQSWREKAEIKAENLTEWSQMQLAA
jgi:DNA polymerase-1